ncbi:MFS transporter [Blastococcus sp. CT_GayMR20]|uniref:MFS transporter n=1 Tax=Blastococcus sp. CT_GayMR20 TaxID=2559609 RepID=UPI00142F4600|nr:MFS transporter [Blastococcus sp. CT_GayMR20]
MGSTTVGSLPVFLVGGLSVQIAADLRLPADTIGTIVAAFWATSALFSVFAGRLGDRFGARKSLVACVLVAAGSLAGAALLGWSWQSLALCLALGGVGNAAAHPASNALINHAVAAGHRGLAFGVKQAAIPMATLLSGLAVPVLALTVGWRWTFVAASALALIPLFLLTRVRAPAGRPATMARSSRREALPSPLRRYLGLTTAATALAAAQTSSIAAFVVFSAVEHDITPSTAGFLLATGSVVSAVCRLGVGAAADHGIGGSMRTVALMLAIGAVGLLAMAAPGASTYVAGCLLAFGGAWGFPGLVHYVVTRAAGPVTARATGIVQAGTYAGGVFGPLLFGIALQEGGQFLAWCLAAAAAGLAATLALLASLLEPQFNGG